MSRRPLVLLAVLALAAAACNSPSSTPAPVTAAPATATPTVAATGAAATQAPATQATGASSVAVTIGGFAFSPDVVSVAVGGTVTWTNNDAAAHTVAATDGSWTSPSLAQGQSWSHTFTKAGSFAYICSIHTSMKGTVTVTP